MLPFSLVSLFSFSVCLFLLTPLTPLFLCVCLSLSFSVSLSLPLSLSLSFSLRLSLCVSVSTLSLHLCLCPSPSLSISASVCLSLSLFVSVFAVLLWVLYLTGSQWVLLAVCVAGTLLTVMYFICLAVSECCWLCVLQVHCWLQCTSFVWQSVSVVGCVYCMYTVDCNVLHLSGSQWVLAVCVAGTLLTAMYFICPAVSECCWLCVLQGHHWLQCTSGWETTWTFRPERKRNVPCMLFYSVIVAASHSGMYQAWDVSTKTRVSTVVKPTFCREQKKSAGENN